MKKKLTVFDLETVKNNQHNQQYVNDRSVSRLV